MRWTALGPFFVAAALLAGCERTVSSDADCVAWFDRCGGCVQQCTAVWDEDADAGACDVDCEADSDPLPECVADLDAGSCAFAD